MVAVHQKAESSYDDEAWRAVDILRRAIARDTGQTPAVLTTLRRALEEGRYADASKVQLDLKQKLRELRTAYDKYAANIL